MTYLWCASSVLVYAQPVEPVISSIIVNVQAAEGSGSLPSIVSKRMAASITVVGEHVLVGHKVTAVQADAGTYANIIQTVFDRVLTGYTIQSVRIEPGEIATVNVQITPWGDTVQQVDIELNAGQYAPEIMELITADSRQVRALAESSLLGVPADALDWAGIMAKGLVRDALAEDLPEFKASLELVSGPRTKLRVTLVPTSAVIQDVTIKLHSNSIPNLFLGELRSSVDDIGKQLQGLPAAFVERHKDYFAQKMMLAAQARSVVRQYGLTIIPVIEAGRNTTITLQVETDQYRVWLEGYLDVGRMNNSTSAKLHIGKFVGRHDELFFETGFEPGRVAWELTPGWGHRLGGNLEVGFKYRLSGSEEIIWFDYQLRRDWLLRFEENIRNHDNQLAVRYKLHDLLGIEYVLDRNDHWLRLVGNL